MTNQIDQDWPHHITVLGVGLLGGSVALAVRRKRPNVVLVGTARSEIKCERLVAAGIVDQATTSIKDACRQSDLVVVATPVDQISSMVIEAADASPNDCVITDVGSTKEQIVLSVARETGAAKKFVAAHPIAGSEKVGFEHAKADLFDGKVIVVTPTDKNSSTSIEKIQHFWQLLGGRIITMSLADHDAHLASISHVPHLVSALVARMATDQSRPLAGSGWEDITRVAAGDPAMWTAICQQNRSAILGELERLATELDRLRLVLGQVSGQLPEESQGESGEAIFDWLVEAKRIKENS